MTRLEEAQWARERCICARIGDSPEAYTRVVVCPEYCAYRDVCWVRRVCEEAASCG